MVLVLLTGQRENSRGGILHHTKILDCALPVIVVSLACPSFYQVFLTAPSKWPVVFMNISSLGMPVNEENRKTADLDDIDPMEGMHLRNFKSRKCLEQGGHNAC